MNSCGCKKGWMPWLQLLVKKFHANPFYVKGIEVSCEMKYLTKNQEHCLQKYNMNDKWTVNEHNEKNE